MIILPRPGTLDLATTRLPVLDGWRGISILLVLVGHMLPLGPKWLELNSMVSAAGLSIFFFLSGFLVVSILLRNNNIASFAIRRVFRILPLAMLVLIPLLLVQHASSNLWLANLLFYANIMPDGLLRHGEHLWSLSLEMQFYLVVGLVIAIFDRRGLVIIPVVCIVITLARIVDGMGVSILTWYRADEILVGGSVALFLYLSTYANVGQKWPAIVPVVLIIALFLCCHDSLKFAEYLRPYVTALLVYSTIYRRMDFLQKVLCGKVLRYFAYVSYALYVIHPLTYAGWLGEGDVLVRYTKRILSFILTFSFAHISSKYYEKYWNEQGHKLAKRLEKGHTRNLENKPQPVANR